MGKLLRIPFLSLCNNSKFGGISLLGHSGSCNFDIHLFVRSDIFKHSPVFTQVYVSFAQLFYMQHLCLDRDHFYE
ncbi:hypothetical protein XENTR_v10009267 [Xenopus tropicalis]|nr:hypothetical protein XENTR_v10009267 [Xenopus tropicalis]